MYSRDWCSLYNKYSKNHYNSVKIDQEVKGLMNDKDEVQKQEGIFEYVLSKDSDPYVGKLLNLRVFSERDKQAAYKKQKGICPICKNKYKYEEMAGDHIKPWSKGGKSTKENCQMLCRDCNLKKSDK